MKKIFEKCLGLQGFAEVRHKFQLGFFITISSAYAHPFEKNSHRYPNFDNGELNKLHTIPEFDSKKWENFHQTMAQN